MEKIQNRIIEKFGNRLRVRVCGICVENSEILLINHHSLNKTGDFWAPPGGGMEFGFSAIENLKREFHEETGLEVEIEKFLFVHEYLKAPLHAIELIFKVKRLSGELKLGFDPEMKEQEQIIKDVRFIPITQIVKMKKDSVHQMLNNLSLFSELEEIQGYFIS
jgi:8-oxo-dGTP diphosphatase